MFQNLASIADVVGAIGVMVSLVFVGLQMRQANKLARAAAQQRQIESLRDISRLLIENPQIASLLMGKRDADLSDTDRLLAVSFMSYGERTWEALYEQYRQGLVDPQMWEAHRRQARAVQAEPINQAVWKLRKQWYSERYQKFRDEDQVSLTDKLSYDIDAPEPQPSAPEQTTSQ